MVSLYEGYGEDVSQLIHHSLNAKIHLKVIFLLLGVFLQHLFMFAFLQMIQNNFDD